jgi:endonuclease/exonuclease/phosphatase family metal-dependent hydrolase
MRTLLNSVRTLGVCALLVAVGLPASLAAQNATPPANPPANPPATKTPTGPKTPADRAPSGKPAGKAPAAPSTPTPGSETPPAGEAQPSTGGKAVRPAGFWYGVEKAPARKPGSVRIAAYNVENLFDDKDDPALQGEFDDIKMVTKPERLKAIADAIRRLDADILSLEEVESLAALTWFRDNYLKGMGYDHAYSVDVGYYRGVEQTFLSRYPITAHRVWVEEDLSDMAAKRTGDGWAKAKPDDKPRFQRSPLMVQVDVKGTPVTLFSVHFKAGGKEFEYHRESEALQTLEFVKEILAKDPKAHVAVMGDFNATPGMKVPKVFSEGGMRSAYDFRAVKKGNTKDLYTTHDSGRAIDFIFLSPALAEAAVDGSFFVLSTVHPASDYDWRKDPDKEKVPPGYASDHYPIAVDVMLGAPKASGEGAKPGAGAKGGG